MSRRTSSDRDDRRISTSDSVSECWRGWCRQACAADQRDVQPPAFFLYTEPMTPNDFRKIALRLQDATEGEHMAHPDFRVQGRIFATLHPDGQQGMVKVTPDQQRDFIHQHPATFTPASGAWGRQGCTMVRLSAVDEGTLGEAMTLAWRLDVASVKEKRQKAKGKTKVRTNKPANTGTRRRR